MPGIAGIISREPAAACRRRLAAMVHSMLHEPCYQSATCEAPEMGVYAGWVAHPGSFAEIESGRSAAGSLDLVFAGECFQECSGTRPAPGDPDRRGESRRSLLRFYDRLGADWVVE